MRGGRAPSPNSAAARSSAARFANRILSMIKSGNLESGDRLPTEAQMGNLPKLADLIFHRLFFGAARITPARFGRVLGKKFALATTTPAGFAKRSPGRQAARFRRMFRRSPRIRFAVISLFPTGRTLVLSLRPKTQSNCF